MHKRVLACAIAFLLATGTGATAADDKDDVDKFFDKIGSFSAEVAGTTDYTFRGISQTNEGPAIQGSFGWSKDFNAGGQKINAFASAWASNVDFSDGDNAHIEIDDSCVGLELFRRGNPIGVRRDDSHARALLHTEQCS